MKARIRKTGEIVDVTRNEHGVYVDENCVSYTLNELDFGNEENDHWQEVRERAAIAAMGQLIGMGRDDGYKYSPLEVANFAVVYANALVEQLKKRN